MTRLLVELSSLPAPIRRRRRPRPPPERAAEVRDVRVAELLGHLVEREGRGPQEQEGHLAPLLLEDVRERDAVRGELALERARRDVHVRRRLLERAEPTLLRVDELAHAR